MRIDLSGKRALVTGSTSGMGYAIARTLAEAGATVVVHGRADERIAAACARLADEVLGADLGGHAADLADAGAVGRLIAAVPDVDSSSTTPGRPSRGRSSTSPMRSGSASSTST